MGRRQWRPLASRPGFPDPGFNREPIANCQSQTAQRLWLTAYGLSPTAYGSRRTGKPLGFPVLPFRRKKALGRILLQVGAGDLGNPEALDENLYLLGRFRSHLRDNIGNHQVDDHSDGSDSLR